MSTQMQKLRTHRERYAQQAQALRQLREFPTEKEQRRNDGQHRCLDDVVHALRFLDDGDLKPKQVQVQTEIILSSLADWKVDSLIGRIRERSRYGLNELAEWIAEGAIMQIDRVFPDLQATFSPQWRKALRVYGHSFQLYHHRDQWRWSVEEAEAYWQSAERAQWFDEVAILKLETAGEVAACLEVIYDRSNSIESPWTQNREVSWVRPGEMPRSTSICDVIVPFFGAAWMVDRAGFRCISDMKKSR